MPRNAVHTNVLRELLQGALGKTQLQLKKDDTKALQPCVETNMIETTGGLTMGIDGNRELHARNQFCLNCGVYFCQRNK